MAELIPQYSAIPSVPEGPRQEILEYICGKYSRVSQVLLKLSVNLRISGNVSGL